MCMFMDRLTTVKRVTMDNDICGVVVCVWNTAISIEVFDAIGEGKDGHVEVRFNAPVRIYKPLRCTAVSTNAE